LEVEMIDRSISEPPLLAEEHGCDRLDEVRRTDNQNVRKNLGAAATKVAGMPSGHVEHWARRVLEGDPVRPWVLGPPRR
jgi:hypothetical protein